MIITVTVGVYTYVYNSRCFGEHVWGRPPAEATAYSSAPSDGLRTVYSLLSRSRRRRRLGRDC